MVSLAEDLADFCRPPDVHDVHTWRRQVEEAASTGGISWRQGLALVRCGILLRRRSDVGDRHCALRREVLGLLPAAESLCHAAVMAAAAGSEAAELCEEVARQIAQDEQYLAAIAQSGELPEEAVAFALESFRDDLHWLSALVSAVEGGRGVDPLERVLIEQESLHRRWGLDEAAEDGGPASAGALQGADRAELCAALADLRAMAVARQVEAFLAASEPADPRGWYRRWQAASRLLARLALAAPAPSPTAAHWHGDAVELPRPAPDWAHAMVDQREKAVRAWQGAVALLPEPARVVLLREAAEDLADRASEAMTFLEEQPTAAAVTTLELARDDIDKCLTALKQQPSRGLGTMRRALRRRQRALDGELQERRLAWRLERLLGRRGALALEKLMLIFLLVFMLMLSVEGPLLRHEAARLGLAVETMTYSRVEAVFAWLDLGICTAFLAEFAFKLLLAQGKWLYVRRNWLTGLLPAIPVGFLAYATHHLALALEGEWVVAVRALRYLRLSRVAQWLRVARPLLRLARLVGFVLWASDRLVRRMSPLLNRNVVLFERAALEEVRAPYQTALESLRERFGQLAADMEQLEPASRLAVVRARVADLRAKLRAPIAALARMPSGGELPAREIPVEDVIVQLLSATPASAAERFGRGLARSIARWCRAFDVFAVRRLPVICDLVAAGRLADPYEAAARAANRLGLLGRRLLEWVYWFADLYGTVTAPQLVDSVGEWMVRGTAQPARRFLLFGTLFVLLSHLVLRLPHPAFLDYVAAFVHRVLGTPLVVLGTLCLAPLLVGLWFRQIAGEARDFYTKVAEAQFLSAAKRMKRRLAQRWHGVWMQRVLGPEANLAGEGPTPSGPLRATVDRLWEDYLDGAPLHPSDTRVTTQLLGNLDLLSLYHSRLRYGRRKRKALRRLDLSAARGSLRGPYLWFHFISRSLTQQTAKLVVDYNAFALPLERLDRASDEELRAYAAWLSRRARSPVEALELPPAVRARLQSVAQTSEQDARAGGIRLGFQGSDFTALHFLSDETELDEDIRRRYGPWVEELMQRDRRDNIRRVFRAYPLHHRPKDQRTFNPLLFYQQHLAGGWVLLFPMKVGWWLAVLGWRGLRVVSRNVAEVLRPPAAEVSEPAEDEPLAVAIRKVHRMRKPVLLQCLHLRAEFDPEYLGALPPGCPGLPGPTVPVDEDLNRIAAEPPLRRQLAQLAARRRRQMLDLRYWLRRLGLENHPPESLRAMALAYIVDHGRVRTTLESARVVERAWGATSTGHALNPAVPPDGAAPLASANAPPGPVARLAEMLATARDILLRPLRFRRRRFEQQAQRVLRYPWLGSVARGCPRHCVRQAWKRPELRKAVQRLAQTSPGADPLAEARQTLQSVARDPATWTRQLVVLRAVQTLTVLDLQLYCELVARLGRYPEGMA